MLPLNDVVRWLKGAVVSHLHITETSRNLFCIPPWFACITVGAGGSIFSFLPQIPGLPPCNIYTVSSTSSRIWKLLRPACGTWRTQLNGAFICNGRGWARTQTPTTRNCTVELPTFAVIAGVSPVRVQWKSLALEETPLWSDLLPRQVSMPLEAIRQKRFFQTSVTLVASADNQRNWYRQCGVGH